MLVTIWICKHSTHLISFLGEDTVIDSIITQDKEIQVRFQMSNAKTASDIIAKYGNAVGVEAILVGKIP